MVILDGKEISNLIVDKLRKIVLNISKQYEKKPHLTAILVGNNPASQTYVNSKIKICNKIGFESSLIKKDDSITENELLEIIRQQATNDSVDGILIQLPLPKHINDENIINSVPAEKDVDGFHLLNVGKLVTESKHGFVSATPLGIKLLLEAYDVSIAGKNVVMVGRSSIVGKPLTNMMISNDSMFGNATVTTCHSKTQNISHYTKQADVVIVAIGKPNFLKADMVKKNAIVIDVGINKVNDANGKVKIVGDVDFDEVSKKASYITPVPGGVGKMTIAALMFNTLKAFINRNALQKSILVDTKNLTRF